MKRQPLTQIEINREITIPFEYMHPHYGRAEFMVCLKFQKGMVSQYWVDPIQTSLDTIWHMRTCYTDFVIDSYHNLEYPKVWLTKWCNEHKTQALLVYAPEHSRYLRLSNHGMTFLKSLLD